MPQSALVFPVYGVATLISAIGSGRQDGDIELSEAITLNCMHGNVRDGPGARGVYLRSQECIYADGGVLLDHTESGRIGSGTYIQHLLDNHDFTRRDALAVCAAGGLRRWRALTPAQQFQHLN